MKKRPPPFTFSKGGGRFFQVREILNLMTLAPRLRQLLHQRQVYRRRGGPAALRRSPGLGHQRQGGHHLKYDPLGQRPLGEGDLFPLPRHCLSLHVPAITIKILPLNAASPRPRPGACCLYFSNRPSRPLTSK